MQKSVTDLCRICGTDTFNIVRHQIFELDGQARRCLAKKINECLPVTVTEQDPLPKIMCGECAYKLDLLSDFRDKAVKTEHFLESIVRNYKETEVSNDEESDEDFDGDGFKSDSIELAEPEVFLKEDSPPGKRPVRLAARKRPIREIIETDEESDDSVEEDEEEDDDEEEEEEVVKPLPKKRGRKPKDKTGECRDCGLRVVDMSAHVLAQHPERVKCGTCGTVCRSEKELRAHRRTEHAEKGAAGECGACGVHVKDLRRHTITKHTHDFPVACSECPKRFVSRSELNSHCRRAHGTNRKEMSLLCKYCGRSFSRKQYLVDHERKHRDERPFECATCGNAYYSKVLLKSHQRVHASAGYAFECDLCHMKFTTQTGCKAHRKRHFDENRRFQCLACGERFFKRATLDAHQISKHTHVKPYECALCAKRFPAKYDLQKHVETHIRVKSQVCEFCGAAYFRPDHLRRHKMQQHRELVPAYRCDICGRLYTEERVLFNHKLRYHKLGNVAAEPSVALAS